MSDAKWWMVDIYINENASRRRTRAEARLRISVDRELRGLGSAKRNPHDPDVAVVGDRLAVARALADLARKLRESAAHELEEVNYHPAELVERDLSWADRPGRLMTFGRTGSRRWPPRWGT